MKRIVIEIEVTELEEIILAILETHKGGLSGERIRYILEGKGIPLSAYQIRHILQQMAILGLTSRKKRSRSYIYSPSEAHDLKQII